MDIHLPSLLRQALRASLVVPVVAACGGQTASSSPGDDSGTRSDSSNRRGNDGAAREDASATDAGCDPNMGCATIGCACGSPEPVCVDGQWQCGPCPPCPGPVDSGNVCKPNLAFCQSTPIPLSCFDGGLPDASSPESPATGDQCNALCGTDVGSCYVGTSSDGGPVALQCTEYCGGGRFFAGARPPRLRAGGALRRHFAEVARLEAVAVDAFSILATELAAHDAPPSLVARARGAAREEARHWTLMRPLALRYGACPKPRRASRRPVRRLVDIALENAVEGCVRETYGAVVAHHQALAAQDAEVRRVMTGIAEDETRHAILSWELARWADARLTPRERARVARARAKAVREMTAALSAPVPDELVRVAGMPDALSAQRMAASLARSLWS